MYVHIIYIYIYIYCIYLTVCVCACVFINLVISGDLFRSVFPLLVPDPGAAQATASLQLLEQPWPGALEDKKLCV